MTAKDKEALIKNKLFSTVGTDFFEKRVEVVSLKKGETVMSSKKFSRCLALIIKGEAEVSKLSMEGKRTVINSLFEDDIFGMATLFYEEANFPSEITAKTPLRLMFFPKELIEEAFTVSPSFAKAYATLLSEKIHFLNGKISGFSETEAPEKLLRWILSNAKGETEIFLETSLSKLAQSLGMSRASLYRAIEVLEERGNIAKDGKKIVILKP